MRLWSDVYFVIEAGLNDIIFADLVVNKKTSQREANDRHRVDEEPTFRCFVCTLLPAGQSCLA